MNICTEKDARPSILEGKRIIVAGYGNQGRPQALNLRDSGYNVVVAARPGGEGWRRAELDRFRPRPFDEAFAEADVVILLVPDEVQGAVFRGSIANSLKTGAALCFAHGFSVAFGEIATDAYDLILVAPKGQGERVREAYLNGTGIPCLFAVERDVSGRARDTALAIAHGLGALRVGAFETSFREEAVSDLFGEQAVLCGGVPALVKRAFRVLTSRGFSPEVAYFECLHELKIIVDLFTRCGFSGMRELISKTAAYGSLKYGEALITDETEKRMERLFDFIQDGGFARDWLDEAGGGGESLDEMARSERRLEIEEVGVRVRRLFPPDDGK
ncbi:MAG TPA: ketol-acid reductoisomerase [Patescibacteria group bacterium]|nr:ketol-acid reductoisomerase [Patescibacteria group bacterium]